MIELIVIHCSDSPNDRDVTASGIHQWHINAGWVGIGYHHVIRRDGTIENGRPPYWTGAHVKGHNHKSLGICLVGRDQFNDCQFISLEKLIKDLAKIYNIKKIVGHRDLDNKKTCPNFDVAQWLSTRIFGDDFYSR